MRLPLVTSHAACKGHAPENTLAGIDKALALGADAIEIDVHCTSDLVPVLLHDDTVDRTTDGTGNVHEMTVEQARLLDAGARQFVPRFIGERIPTLAEAVDLIRGRALLMVEIKQPSIEEHVATVLRDSGAVNDCEVHSFLPQVVRRMREVEPKLSAALLVDGGRVVEWAKLFAFALSLGAQGVSVHYTFATPEIVRQGQRRSLTFMTWTVDDESAIERMVTAGADSICSNFPDVVREIVQRAVRA